jgi:hypothetical protein
MFAISLSSYSRYNANFKFEQSVLAYHDSPPYFLDRWGWPPTETSLVTHACNDWWTLDFANAFVSQGVNSRGEISTIAPRAYTRNGAPSRWLVEYLFINMLHDITFVSKLQYISSTRQEYFDTEKKRRWRP